MRTLPIAIAALMTSMGFAQSPFYFTHPAPAPEMTAMATMIRTVADLQDITVDEAHHSLAAQGPEAKMVMADWLFHQLDKPAPPGQAGPVPEYKMAGQNAEIVKVFYAPPDTKSATLTAAVTALRTVADLQRIFPFEAQKAIVARGSDEKIAAADWVVRQLWPPDGSTATGDSGAYPLTLSPHEPNAAIRIFRMNPDSTNLKLTSTVTAIRTVGDLQRLFPFEAEMALIAQGPPEKLAVAEWLVHELDKPSDAPATHQTTLAGVPDGAIRVFFLNAKNSSADLTALATQIRSKGIQRVFPVADSTAIVVRGEADRMPAIEALVAEHSAALH